MRSRWNTVYFFLVLYIFLDIYTYQGLKSIVPSKTLNVFRLLYAASSVYVYYSFYQVYQTLQSGSIFTDASSNFYLGVFLSVLVGKLFFVGLMLFQDVGRLLAGLVIAIKNGINGKGLSSTATFFPARRRFLTLSATTLASLPLFSMLYGITKGKYRYTLESLQLTFKDLPVAFDGFKLIQISDIHAGSFEDAHEVAKGIQLINEQKPDLILFTGDLVNSDKNEIDPFIDIFKQLQSKYGQYATLGNHDYYGVPDDMQEAKAYWQDFYYKYQSMGFELMNNSHKAIEKDGQKLHLVGVENWGAGPYFPKKGDLDKALEGMAADDFCILMSHDPTHWDAKVLPHPKHFPLTLSGHTHGFQFGINVPGFKWSPAKYRYPRWMGLYEENGQKLYVNRGFGFLGFPGRVGMWPEITVIELKVG